MKTAAIICECNPLHAGHQYLIACARASGADCVLCVMSGCFVQRGEAAIAEPYLRAEALLCGGADVVLELPFPFSAASAEFFARAGVEVADRLGADELWFGSECGEIGLLSRLSQIAQSAEFAERYEKTVTESRGTAQAYFETLQALAGSDVPCSPNDILALSYLRAIAERDSRLKPVTVKREGSAYLDETLVQGGFPSATALRKCWREDGVEAILPHLPQACAPVYARAEQPADLQYAERLILGFLRLTPVEAFENIAELSGGLAAHLAQAACRAKTLDELWRLSATKKYPTARLRRGVLYALTGVTREDLHAPVGYARLLAANATGQTFLSLCRRTSELSVVTRHTDLPNTEQAQRQEALERRAYALYDLCFPSAGELPSPWRRAPVFL